MRLGDVEGGRAKGHVLEDFDKHAAKAENMDDRT